MPKFIDVYFPLSNYGTIEKRKQSLGEFLTNNPLIIKSPTGEYKLFKYLASGAFGDVFAANKDGNILALKISAATTANNNEAIAYKAITPKCGAYMLCLLDAFNYTIGNKTWLVLVQPLMNGDLENISPSFEDTGFLLWNLLQAVDCMYSLGIAHLDIKPENIFYKKVKVSDDYDNIYKLGDPGLACSNNKMIGLNLCSIHGTFIPPNLIYKAMYLSEPITLEKAHAIDLWAIGATIYDLLQRLDYYREEDMDKIDSSVTESLVNREEFLAYENRILPDEVLRTKFTRRVSENTPIYLNQSTIENALATLLDYKTPRTARQVLRQIVRDQKWAKPGEEDSYIDKNKRKSDCL